MKRAFEQYWYLKVASGGKSLCNLVLPIQQELIFKLPKVLNYQTAGICIDFELLKVAKLGELGKLKSSPHLAI